MFVRIAEQTSSSILDILEPPESEGGTKVERVTVIQAGGYGRMDDLPQIAVGQNRLEFGSEVVDKNVISQQMICSSRWRLESRLT